MFGFGADTCPAEPAGAGAPVPLMATPPEPTSPPPPGGIRARVVVLDFDLTLTAVHVYAAVHQGLLARGIRDGGAREHMEQLREVHLSRGADHCTEALWGGAARLRLLAEVLEGLAAVAELRVLTHNWSSVATALLEIAGLSSHFTQVWGCDTPCVQRRGGIKAAVLRDLLQEHPGMLPGEVLFVDDDMKNLVGASRLGFRVFWADGGAGLSRERLMQLLAVAEGRALTSQLFRPVRPLPARHPLNSSGGLELFGEHGQSVQDAARRLRYKPQLLPQRTNGKAVAILPNGQLWLLEAVPEVVSDGEHERTNSRSSRGSADPRRQCVVL